MPRRDPVTWVLQLLQSDDVSEVEINAGGKNEESSMVRMTHLKEQWRDLVRKLETDHGIFIPNPDRALQGAILMR